jgi:hypothetical protein
MTDAWRPKRGAARHPQDDDSKGIWFRCLRSLAIKPRKFYSTRHTFIAWTLSDKSESQGARGILRNVRSDDRAELR